jgi:hypothetical protein
VRPSWNRRRASPRLASATSAGKPCGCESPAQDEARCTKHGRARSELSEGAIAPDGAPMLPGAISLSSSSGKRAARSGLPHGREPRQHAGLTRRCSLRPLYRQEMIIAQPEPEGGALREGSKTLGFRPSKQAIEGAQEQGVTYGRVGRRDDAFTTPDRRGGRPEQAPALRSPQASRTYSFAVSSSRVRSRPGLAQELDWKHEIVVTPPTIIP